MYYISSFNKIRGLIGWNLRESARQWGFVALSVCVCVILVVFNKRRKVSASLINCEKL